MIPILYRKDATTFETNGIGRLSGAISCIVTEERNGAYELAMEYDEDGQHAADLETDRIIYAKPSALHSPQPFRIYKITKPLNKRFKVLARHISYDLNYAITMPCGPYNTATTALAGMLSNTEGTIDFQIGTVTVSTAGVFQATEPASFRNWVGGREGSILDAFGGELEWDHFTVKLHNARGLNRGLHLRYGKNISDISKIEGIEHTVCGVAPYMRAGDESILTLPEKIIELSIPYPPGTEPPIHSRLISLDCTQYVDEQAIREANPTETDQQIDARLITAMRSVATDYVNDLSLVPVSSIEVAYVNLGDTEEYKSIKEAFIQADLCDIVTVEFERLGITTQAKIIKTEYNVLLERFEKLTIGKTKTSLGDKLQELTTQSNNALSNRAMQLTADALVKAIKEAIAAITTAKNYTDARETQIRTDEAAAIAASLAESKTYADAREQDAINTAASNTANAIATNTALITGANGGYVKFKYDANNKPIEILIMDTDNEDTAVKIWRWNINGLGYSSTGKSGPFTTALSQQGIFNTDFIAANTLSGTKIIAGTLDAGKITTGYLDASIIKVGSITDQAQRNVINMVDGSFSLANGRMLCAANSSYISLYDNLSLRLNGIPLAGQKIDVGVVEDSEYVNNVYVDMLEKPYECTLSGVIAIKKDFTYNGSPVDLVRGIPMPEFAFNSSRYIAIIMPRHYIDGGGGIQYRQNHAVLWIYKKRGIVNKTDFEQWAEETKYYNVVGETSVVYEVDYGVIQARSDFKNGDYIEVTVTYATSTS